MIDQTSLDGKVIIAAFDLAASPGWQDISLRDIADAAGVSLAEVMQHFESKSDILKAFVNHVDHAMLAGAGDVEREQSSRDAVFEVIMSRFDLMAPYKAGLKGIAKDKAALAQDPDLIRLALKSQNRILQAAGISTSGAPALLRQLGLARVYGQVFRIWLDDDDAGMARTMAALDKRLRQGEQTLRTLDDVASSMDRLRERAENFAAAAFSNLRAAAQRTRPQPSADASVSPNEGASAHPPAEPAEGSPAGNGGNSDISDQTASGATPS